MYKIFFSHTLRVCESFCFLALIQKYVADRVYEICFRMKNTALHDSQILKIFIILKYNLIICYKITIYFKCRQQADFSEFLNHFAVQY